VAGDPAYAEIERRLAELPAIVVPTVTLDGEDDGVRPPAPAEVHARRFAGPHAHRLVPRAGHNLPQEAPGAFCEAVLGLL